MERYLLAYIFLCFSVGLVCLGTTVALSGGKRSRLARFFLALYLFLSLSVLGNLLLAFAEVVPQAVSLPGRLALEYLEAIVGLYGVLFILPLLAHRIFAVRSSSRDRWVVGVVLATLVLQHGTEYGLGGSWDTWGDHFENGVAVGIVLYTLGLGLVRRRRAGVPQPLADRFLILLVTGLPGILHDLFLVEASTLRVLPLWYCVSSVVMSWTLVQQGLTSGLGQAPAEWGLSERETEVVDLLRFGLSNKEIAAKLGISSNTVKTHLRTVFDKSGIRSRLGLLSRLAAHPEGDRTSSPS